MAKLFNLVKMVRFWQFNDLDFIVNHNNGKTKKQIKQNWPIWARDTSCLFTNAYVSVPQVTCFLIGRRRVNTTSLFIIIPHCFTVRVWNQLAFRVRRADYDPSGLRSPFPHLFPSQPKRDFHSRDMHKLFLKISKIYRNSTVAINDQWLLLKPELLWLLIVNALQLNELSALRNTFYPEYKYLKYIYFFTFQIAILILK